MAERQVLGWGTQNAPASRVTKGSENFTLLALEATFDGTGAAGSFVPALQIVSDAGEPVGTFPLSGTLAAGDSATVTFAPFLRDTSTSAGIQYDVANSGGWLDIHSTTRLSPDGGGIDLVAEAGQISLTATDPVFGQIAFDTTFEHHDLHNNIVRYINVSLFDIEGTAFTFGPGTSWTLQTTNASMNGDADDTIRVQLASGKPFTVTDHLNNPIFRVDENGDLHGKTGKALVFDL